jgi:hypothetical protein
MVVGRRVLPQVCRRMLNLSLVQCLMQRFVIPMSAGLLRKEMLAYRTRPFARSYKMRVLQSPRGAKTVLSFSLFFLHPW